MALVVLTGGARSGKSALAQELARVRALDGTRVAVAVFADEGQDDETAGRVERHRHDRPADFGVIEAGDSRSWTDAVADDDLLVVDCLGTLVTMVMDETLRERELLAEIPKGQNPAAAPTPDEQTALLPTQLASEVEARVNVLLEGILTRSGDTIVVTNEVGDGVVPPFASGRLFRDVLGRANKRLVSAADVAYLVTCGRALDITALPQTVHWPED